jgi:hypothetical protein
MVIFARVSVHANLQKRELSEVAGSMKIRFGAKHRFPGKEMWMLQFVTAFVKICMGIHS